ncbi:MAG: hypothetical protein Q9165_000761 [Trypethelium subeluteriae]
MSRKKSTTEITEICEVDEAGRITATYVQVPSSQIPPDGGKEKRDARIDVVVSTESSEDSIFVLPSINSTTPDGHLADCSLLSKAATKSWLQTYVLDVFLPAGYPHSVTDDYLKYQIYDSLQAFSSSIAGLLSSRAVLEGVGVGDPTTTPTTALLLSTTTDAVSRLCTILLAHRLGTALAPECKRYRLMADLLNDAGMVLDLLSPAVPMAFSWGMGGGAAGGGGGGGGGGVEGGDAGGGGWMGIGWSGRWMVLCAASCLRAGCGVLAGGAKASLSAKFARGADVGELNAKDASQETVISLLGMLTGTLVVRVITSPLATWMALLSLLAIHLATNYLAVRAVTMTSLNRQRANILFSHLLVTGKVLDPGEVAEREKVFEEDGVLRWNDGRKLGRAKIGVTLGTLLEKMGARDKKTGSMKITNGGDDLLKEQEWQCCMRDNYSVWWDQRESTAYVTLGKKCEPWQQLRAWMQALVLAAMANGIAIEDKVQGKSQIAEKQIVVGNGISSGMIMKRAQQRTEMTWQLYVIEMKRKGWDLDTAVLETRPGTRLSLSKG